MPSHDDARRLLIEDIAHHSQGLMNEEIEMIAEVCVILRGSPEEALAERKRERDWSVSSTNNS